MPDFIYIEREIADHPRTQALLARYPKAHKVSIDRYTEVFNRAQQDFRLQKKRPALILARKHQGRVLAAPDGYGIGSAQNFYFSHLYNCPFDCRYCFLQGMYRSANHVLFVNYEDFVEDIKTTAQSADNPCFFTGYDCDSLALESVTGFARYFLPQFAKIPKALFELRTKSTHTQTLLKLTPLPNVVVALSLTPQEISQRHEHLTPALQKRLASASALAKAGWRMGLRFDPLIYDEDFKGQYQRLLKAVFAAIPAASIHSVSIGPLRFPQAVFRSIARLYPQESLLAGPLTTHPGPGRQRMMSYPPELERQMHGFVRDLLLSTLPASVYFSCTPKALSPNEPSAVAPA